MDFFNPPPRTHLLILGKGKGKVRGAERGGEKEREREEHRCSEKNMDQLPLVCTLTGGKTCNLGMCPDQESNPQSFSLGDNVPTK